MYRNSTAVFERKSHKKLNNNKIKKTFAIYGNKEYIYNRTVQKTTGHFSRTDVIVNKEFLQCQ